MQCKVESAESATLGPYPSRDLTSFCGAFRRLTRRPSNDTPLMTAPQAATIANEINAEIRPLLLNRGHTLPVDDPDWIRLADLCDTLQRVDVYAGSALKSDLYFLAGDYAQAEYFAQNIIKNGNRALGASQLVAIFGNAGFASRGAAVLSEALAVELGQINNVVRHSMSCAGFSEVVNAAANLRRAGGTFEQGELLMKAERALAALEVLGVPQSRLQAMMDEAGSLLRANKLLWLNDTVDVITSSPGSSPFVSMRYRLAVSPARAAEMTWELAENLAEKDLIASGVSVAFVGRPAQ